MASSSNSIRLSNRRISENSSPLVIDGYCHCFFCDLLTEFEQKGIATPGLKCLPCGKEDIMSRACWNKKRRCTLCQLFCRCYICTAAHPLSKVTLWTEKEAQPCSGCEVTCISLECSSCQRLCEDCYDISRLPIPEDEVEVFPELPFNEDLSADCINDDLEEDAVVESSAGAPGTTMDDEQIISDLQQTISSTDRASRIITAKLKAVKSAKSKSRKNKASQRSSSSMESAYNTVPGNVHPPSAVGRNIGTTTYC